jgi:hypothetical protein
MPGSPYDALDARAFWLSAVATRRPGRLRGVYDPRFAVTRDTAIVTAGSCFAQHVHRALKAADFTVVEAEPAPEGVAPEVAGRFFYGTFSARYGNIYTPRHFRQLLEEAAGARKPAHPVWERDGRFYDALRPNVDPGGFAKASAVQAARKQHLAAVSRAMGQADVVILTLGLTETWQDRPTGTVYPTAPGVIADAPKGADIGFLALSHDDVVADLRAILAHLRGLNHAVRLILTVAPGPLVATAAGGHVLVATAACKAILRAAVATMMAEDDGVDYFPSYEIITNPAARGGFFQPNLRTPTPKGIAVVLGHFLAAHDLPTDVLASNDLPDAARPLGRAKDQDDVDEAICEEVLNDSGGARR